MEKNNIYHLCMIALLAAVISILAQFSIPTPFGVPFSLQNFAIILAAILLGKRNSTIAVCIYLILGLIGLPVFANFRSGLQTFLSPTGGFLLGYPFMTYLIGYAAEHRHQKRVFILFVLLGYIVDYLLGLLLFCFVTSCSIKTGILTCVLPFLPMEIVKSTFGILLSLQLKKRLQFLS